MSSKGQHSVSNARSKLFRELIRIVGSLCNFAKKQKKLLYHNRCIGLTESRIKILRCFQKPWSHENLTTYNVGVEPREK